MTTRRRSSLALLLAATMLLGGCARSVPRQSAAVTATLPPAAQPYAAPLGDASLSETVAVDLYLPALSGEKLIARQSDVTLPRGRHPAEAILRALLSYEGDEVVRALRNGTVRSMREGAELQLSGTNPVEVSCGVCTVTLASSALALEHQDLYAIALSMAATLRAYGVQSVNLLVAGQAPGMDITASLPMGAVSARTAETLTAAWEQLDARKPALGTDPAQVSLTAPATLYFPAATGSGILSETRDLSFPGQTPAQLAAGLLGALSAGSRELACAFDMPDLSAWLLAPPELKETAEGTRTMVFTFAGDLPDRLAASGLDAAGFAASLVYTMTTFIPALNAVTCYVGGELLTSVRTSDYQLLTFPDGLMTRAAFHQLLMDEAVLYLARDDMLFPVLRAVPYYEARSPRYLIQRLMEGPTTAERTAGYTSLLPAALGDADILGVSLEGTTLLVNLSTSFATMSRTLSPRQEYLMAYQLIDTLCAATNVLQIRFYFGGAPQDEIAGTIWWSTPFLPLGERRTLLRLSA